MLHIILYEPEIPQNTGNIGRLCAITRSCLHLIHPLGFKVNDRYLKRSGMDYWHDLDIYHHENWGDFLMSPNRPRKIWLFSTKAETSFWTVKFTDDDGLLFGNEGSGCPQNLHAWVGDKRRVTIPHFNKNLRSLNLSTCVGIAVYEALRQIEVSNLSE